MNVNTGQVFPTFAQAISKLKPGEKASDIVEVVGTPEAVRSLSQSVQRANAIDKRRAKNKTARTTRQAQRRRR